MMNTSPTTTTRCIGVAKIHLRRLPGHAALLLINGVSESDIPIPQSMRPGVFLRTSLFGHANERNRGRRYQREKNLEARPSIFFRLVHGIALTGLLARGVSIWAV